MLIKDQFKNQDFTLSLSSGYFGFFAHCGFVKAVYEEGLKPKLLTGSSAGAIVSACLASGMTPLEMEKEFLTLGKHSYWDPAFGFGVLKGEIFEKTLKQFLKADFADLQTPLRIATYNIRKRKTEIFDQGPLAKVVRASCSMPLYFHPVKIGDHHYWDGGINDKMGWTGIAESELILGHWLPSDKISDWFERRSNKQASAGASQILKIQNLPPTGPGHFANAPKAIALAYEETKRFLNQTVVD
ncbi:patatin-like phospholipase family protein [Bdellovibrio svalbardensis]|uniref:Patatin-like phospholipase family protein n=1 Tax=Bdellovibrio svalbardensis TaxID=2972972 RepID=A0ABT6DH01_9BACT|nr:patatin-like phospholipase family protein [Bdellovibrio svalbardensis]MDG0815116.1 patatin-like phospholipase family protein [Bdellovibrio svalbardensis]